MEKGPRADLHRLAFSAVHGEAALSAAKDKCPERGLFFCGARMSRFRHTGRSRFMVKWTQGAVNSERSSHCSPLVETIKNPEEARPLCR